MESHASAAAERKVIRGPRASLAAGVRRLYTELDAPIALALAALLAALAFVGNGGLQLGSSTVVEIGVILVASAVVAASIVYVGARAVVHGGMALAAVGALAALTALSILWSLYPSDSWVEANRTLAYAAAFAAGIGAVRLARERWAAVGWGVLIALGTICGWGLLTKIAPGWLAPDEVYARLREPYGYWNAVGLTAAMGIPLCLWLGTRDGGRRASSIAAYPLLSMFVVTMLLSYSRGSLLAALVGVALWLALVPLRLRGLALLGTSVAAAAIVTAWTFSQSALSDDRVALSDRESAGIELGLILLAMVVLTALAGWAIQRRAERHPLDERTRRRIGTGALAALAAVPVVVLLAMAVSDRGIGGTVSDRWHDLTSEQSTPQNDPGRLIQTGSVRTIYWGRALDVWRAHTFAGAGAGAFANAQLRYRKQPAQGRHAHGYVHQTLADLGILGLAVSLLALGAWLLAALRTLGLRRRASLAWTPERQALAALTLVAVVFGVHSAVDWTWFVPAVAVTALFCAGWVAGRGPLTAGQESAGNDPTAAPTAAPTVPPLAAVAPRRPEGRGLRVAVGVAAAVVALGVLSSVAVSQPWRSERKGNDALDLASKGDFKGALAATNDAEDLDPLSVDTYFDRAVVEDSARNRPAALAALEHAVQLEPANPETWRRLGEYQLQELSRPSAALPYLRASLYLDPFSPQTRSDYVEALRADQAARAALAQRRARASSARRQSGKPPQPRSSSSP